MLHLYFHLLKWYYITMSIPMSGDSYYDFIKWWDKNKKGWIDLELQKRIDIAKKRGKLVSFKNGKYIYIDKEKI